MKSKKTILACAVIGVLIILSIIIAKTLIKKNNEGLADQSLAYQLAYPFNFGTREWASTKLMSHDIRGDVPIVYQPEGPFNQPEVITHAINKPLIEQPTIAEPPVENKKMIGVSPQTGNPYYIEPNFYTYDYVNPLIGVVPPVYNSTMSVPYKV